MKHVSIAALALGLTLGGMAATPVLAKDKAPAKEAPAAKPSEAVIKAAAVIQPALAKKDFAAAKTALDGVAGSLTTPEDKLYVGQWYIQVGQGTNDMATLGKGIDLALESGKTDGEMTKRLAYVQGQLAFQAKDYAKAQTSMQRAIAAGNTEENAVPILIESLRNQNKRLEALTAINELVAKAQAASQPVPASWFQRGFAIAYEIKANDPAYAQVRQAGLQLSKKWVAADPRGEVWHDAVLLYRDSGAQDAELRSDSFRLLLAANGLRAGPEYLEYAEAVYQRFPGEAKAALDAGVKKGVLNLAANRNAAEVNQIAGGKIAADKASLPGSEKAARAAANGKAALGTADAYLGYGDNAKAVDLYNVALTKGGVDANVVNTRIGIALYRSGDAAGAKAAFAKVTGQRKDLADFWVTLIDHPAQG